MTAMKPDKFKYRDMIFELLSCDGADGSPSYIFAVDFMDGADTDRLFAESQRIPVDKHFRILFSAFYDKVVVDVRANVSVLNREDDSEFTKLYVRIFTGSREAFNQLMTNRGNGFTILDRLQNVITENSFTEAFSVIRADGEGGLIPVLCEIDSRTFEFFDIENGIFRSFAQKVDINVLYVDNDHSLFSDKRLILPASPAVMNFIERCDQDARRIIASKYMPTFTFENPECYNRFDAKYMVEYESDSPTMMSVWIFYILEEFMGLECNMTPKIDCFYTRPYTTTDENGIMRINYKSCYEIDSNHQEAWKWANTHRTVENWLTNALSTEDYLVVSEVVRRDTVIIRDSSWYCFTMAPNIVPWATGVVNSENAKDLNISPDIAAQIPRYAIYREPSYSLAFPVMDFGIRRNSGVYAYGRVRAEALTALASNFICATKEVCIQLLGSNHDWFYFAIIDAAVYFSIPNMVMDNGVQLCIPDFENAGQKLLVGNSPKSSLLSNVYGALNFLIGKLLSAFNFNAMLAEIKKYDGTIMNPLIVLRSWISCIGVLVDKDVAPIIMNIMQEQEKLMQRYYYQKPNQEAPTPKDTVSEKTDAAQEITTNPSTEVTPAKRLNHFFDFFK